MKILAFERNMDAEPKVYDVIDVIHDDVKQLTFAVYHQSINDS